MTLHQEIKREWEPPSDQITGVEWLGVDVGWVYPAADSDGQIYHWAKPAETRRTKRETTEAGPLTIKRANGQVVTTSAYSPEQLTYLLDAGDKIGNKIRVRSVATRIVNKARDSGRGLVLEEWGSFSKRRSPWVVLWEEIKFQATKKGVVVRTVNPAYSSQTCPSCGHVAKGNRATRNRFKCQKCSHSGQADLVAAENLRCRAERPIYESGQCSNPDCVKVPWKAGLCCSCYFFKRRYGVLPDAERNERLQVAKDYRDFHKTLEEVGAPNQRPRPNPELSRPNTFSKQQKIKDDERWERLEAWEAEEKRREKLKIREWPCMKCGKPFELARGEDKWYCSDRCKYTCPKHLRKLQLQFGTGYYVYKP